MSTDQTSVEVEQAGGNAHETVPANAESSSSPGTRLARHRQERGLSQKEVADKLHITIHYVNAIEHDAYEKLPGTVFAKGYIRRYAELLNLGVEDYLQDFDQLQVQQQGAIQQQVNRRRRASGRRNRSMAFASMLLFVGVFVAVWYFSGEEDGAGAVIVNSAAEPATGANEESVSAPGVAPAPVATLESSATPEPAMNAQPSSLSASSAETQLDTLTPGPSTEPDPTGPTNQAAVSTGLIEQEQSGNQQSAVMEEDIKAAELNDSGSRETDIAVIPEPVAIVEQAVSPATEARVITVQADGSDVLRISFSGESWVEVNDGASNEIYRDLLEAGDILQITGTAPFNVLLGDAPFTELTFNGDVVDVSGNIRIDNSARLTVGL